MGVQGTGAADKTKRMLSGALMKLLDRRSFRKITVGDICREAMISRSAFYSHFADKYELLSFTLNGLIRLQNEKSGEMTLEQKTIVLLENMQRNRRTIYHMLMADVSREMMDIFIGAFEVAIRERLEQLQKNGVELPGPVSLIAAFYAGGFANIAVNWIRENFATPKEEVARCQCRLLRQLMTDGGGNGE